MAPEISVIVVNWNGRDLLRECMQSLCQQTWSSMEVIVVDNGSTDGSSEYVRTCFANVNLIELPKNLGFCTANNVGYAHARGTYIALLNNDTRVAPEWLEALHDALQRYPQAGAAASKVVFYDEPNLIDTAGDSFLISGIGRKRGHRLPDGEAFDREEFVFGACAGAALYRKSMLEQIGFLDDDFFAYNEDIDLSFRAQLAGWTCIYVPKAKVWHHVSATGSRIPRIKRYLDRRNTAWVIMKNIPAKLFIKYGVLIIGYHLASDLKWSLLGDAGPILRGRMDALRSWKTVMAKRRVVQSLRSISTRELEAILCHELPFRVPRV